MLSSLLIRSKAVWHLDLSMNGIDARSVFCLAEAVAVNVGLRYLILDSNPLGKLGISLLMKAETTNILNSFSVSMKGADQDAAVDTRLPVFDRSNPEATYQLDLTKTYD